MASKHTGNSKSTVEKKSGTYSAMEFVLLLAGITGLVIGLLHMLVLLLEGFDPIRLGDMLTNVTVGALVLNCWRLLKERRTIVFLVFFGAMVINLVWSFVSGRGFNFISAGFGAIILLQLIMFRRTGELA